MWEERNGKRENQYIGCCADVTHAHKSKSLPCLLVIGVFLSLVYDLYCTGVCVYHDGGGWGGGGGWCVFVVCCVCVGVGVCEHMCDSIFLCRYFTQLFMAQLVLVSPDLIPPFLLEKIQCHMQELLDTANPLELMRFEETCRFSWSIFSPYVKLLYIPNTPAVMGSTSTTMIKLQSLSIQVAIFCLTSNLSRPSHQEIMAEERLLDYVICMPWHVPEEVKTKADEVVRALAAHKPLQPPSLSSIAKAKLAKMHFGLERIMRMQSIHDLFIELYPALYVST